jgi:tetratricopeptide (TPR) repeat protein
MKVKSPSIRHKFANEWDELEYLYDQLLYWLYERQNPAKARRYAKRMAPLLEKADPDHEAIFGEECRSLMHEAKGDLPKAIEHRKNEIRLVRRLHEISHQAPFENRILKDYGYADLSDRLDLLALLYYENGDLDEAMTTLLESKQLCKEHGIKFDAEDVLKELEHESRQANFNSYLNSHGTTSRRSTSAKQRKVI